MANENPANLSSHLSHEESKAPDEFFELLKQGTPTPATSTDPKDEARSTVGMTGLRDNPEGRSKDAPDAPWGEKGPGPIVHSEGATTENAMERLGILRKAFSGTPQAERELHELVSQNFTHGASGQFTTRTALLKTKAKLAYPRAASLMEMVRQVTGRH